MKAKGFNRIYSIGLGMTVFAALILVQMIRIQVIDTGRKLGPDGEKYVSKPEVIQPERGLIYDRYGNVLATNRKVYEIGLDLSRVTDPDTLTNELVSILGLDYNDVHSAATTKFVQAKSEYLTIAPLIEPEKVKELQDRASYYDNKAKTLKLRKGEVAPNLDGIEYRPRLVRSYPEKTLASNLLGFMSFRDVGTARPYFGVEEFYNEMLSGNAIKHTFFYDPFRASKEPIVPPGDSLVLTIDREIQAMLESVIDDHVKSTGAVSGTIVVLDPKTGEILGIATTPRFDPNQYWTLKDIFPDSTPFDRAIGQTYEPGSVFKVITMASALDNGTVKPDTMFTDTGVLWYGGYPIYNWDRGAWGPQSMQGCMEHSLNVCLAHVSTTMGAGPFYSYLKTFGIGRRTNVDMAGEVNFPLSVPSDENWYDINLATNAFGQGLAVTPLQIASAISAVANDGKMMAPHIVKSVISNGHQRDVTPTMVSAPIKPETAHVLSDMLEKSVLSESYDNAKVPGYRVAGKTGTGEIPSPEGYISNLTNASFVGWGPVEDPRFLVYVWLEKPTKSIWGSYVAAPVFSEVVSKLVVLMDIPPDRPEELTADQSQ
jgi:cell division protein FtsI/penicillin-binding protein 2